MDIAGVIINAGSSTDVKVGDHIIAAGIVGYSDGCSFQTHVLVNETNYAKINKDVPLSAASTIPFCLSTAACGLYLGLDLSIIRTDTLTVNANIPVLIWGANGNVGSLAIQLAKISGYFVIAITSSRQTTTKAKSCGADLVLSNDESDVLAKIQSAAPNLRLAFDTVVTDETISKIGKCISSPGIIATAIKYFGELPKNCEIKPVFSGEIFGKTAVGSDCPRGRESGKWLWSNTSQWLDDGQLTPLEYQEIGDLSDVETGLRMMQEHKIRTNLVVRAS